MYDTGMRQLQWKGAKHSVRGEEASDMHARLGSLRHFVMGSLLLHWEKAWALSAQSSCLPITHGVDCDYCNDTSGNIEYKLIQQYSKRRRRVVETPKQGHPMKVGRMEDDAVMIAGRR